MRALADIPPPPPRHSGDGGPCRRFLQSPSPENPHPAIMHSQSFFPLQDHPPHSSLYFDLCPGARSQKSQARCLTRSRIHDTPSPKRASTLPAAASPFPVPSLLPGCRLRPQSEILLREIARRCPAPGRGDHETSELGAARAGTTTGPVEPPSEKSR